MYPYVSIHTRTHTQCVRVLGERMGGNKKTTLGERVRILGEANKGDAGALPFSLLHRVRLTSVRGGATV